MKKVPSNNVKELEKQKLSLMQFERTFKPVSDFDKLKETLKEIQKIIKRIGTNNEIEIIESAKELVNFVNFELGKKVPENKEKNEIENENAKTSENKEKPEKESLSDNDEEHTYKDKEHKFR